MKNNFLFPIIFLILFACQKELEIPIPEFKQKTVVSCLFTADTVFKVRLSKTISINESTETLITDAKVYLLCENNVIDTLLYSNDFYVSNIFPQQNITYKIKIITTGFDTIYCMSKIPNNFELYNIRQQDYAVPDGGLYSPFSKFEITLNDIKGEENFYEVSLIIKRDWNDSLYFNPFYYVPISSKDDILIKENLFEYKSSFFVFSDSLFDGQIKTFAFLYRPNWQSSASGQDGSVVFYGEYRLYYKIRSISQDMYNYRKSLIKHLYNQQTDDITRFGDPVQMWTNITNGYGIFAGYVEYSDTIFVERTYFNF
jgi:hypothetical protein